MGFISDITKEIPSESKINGLDWVIDPSKIKDVNTLEDFDSLLENIISIEDAKAKKRVA